MDKKEKILKSGDWTVDFVKEANKNITDENVYPICIPTYKRGVTCNTIQFLKNTKTKKYLFIYRDDYDIYKEVETNPEYINFEIVFVDIPKKGIQPKREFIRNYMIERNHKQIFMIDDDIEKTVLGITIKNTSPKNKRDKIVQLQEIPLIEGLKTTQYSFERNKDKNIGVMSGGTFFQITFRDFTVENELSFDKLCVNCILLNLELLDKYDIHYTTEKTWEDFDILIKCVLNDINVCTNRFISYKVVPREKQISVIFGEKSINSNYSENIASYTMNLYKIWGDIVEVKNVDGGLNDSGALKKLHNRVKKNEKIEIKFDDTMLDLCNRNDVQGFIKHTTQLVIDNKNRLQKEQYTKIENFIKNLNIDDTKNQKDFILDQLLQNKNIPNKYAKKYVKENYK